MRTLMNVTTLSVALAAVVHAAANPPQSSESAAPIVAPKVTPGVTIVELDQQPVPEILKNQARAELGQMKRQGYVDASDDRVQYLQKARRDTEHLKPWSEIRSKVKVGTASLKGSPLETSVILGSSLAGGPTPEGSPGAFRLFDVRSLGLVGLEEIDLVESGGGWAMIKEAINQDINGNPAILTVYRGPKGDHLTTMSWVAGRKMYTLSTDHSLNSAKAMETFLSIARSVVD